MHETVTAISNLSRNSLKLRPSRLHVYLRRTTLGGGSQLSGPVSGFHLSWRKQKHKSSFMGISGSKGTISVVKNERQEILLTP